MTEMTTIDTPRIRVEPIQLECLADEVREMEAALALFDRHAALKAEMQARGLSLIESAVSMKAVAAAMAPVLRVTAADLRGRGNHKLSTARGLLVMALYERFLRTTGDRRWSLPAIGRFMGDRDHTTVLYLMRKAHAALDAGLAEVGFRAPQPVARTA